MKSVLFLLVILPVVSCFVSLNVPQHLLKPVASRLYERPTSTEGSVTKNNNSTMSDADFIAKQTIEMLEAMGDDAKNADEEEEEDEYPIFNPNSFWTERSGRFPRKMNE